MCHRIVLTRDGRIKSSASRRRVRERTKCCTDEARSYVVGLAFREISRKSVDAGHARLPKRERTTRRQCSVGFPNCLTTPIGSASRLDFDSVAI